ncbi:thiolase family protein [Pseudonocardia sp. KRD291]|uniref:thiolase family protein n=1 Tax=Pseudonocardia sp. KRD291 TaxID=2792007 RepID=UPI001C4A4A3D|nr:thiolase family protein [Pseudonocardia sp. KRD291]MBW0101021.1 thiolase family protein [Pseudonocardia sp. KRD291]
MTDVVVEGVGIHPFGRFDGTTPTDLGVYAVRDALRDAGTDWSEVGALYCAHMYAGTGAGHKIVDVLGRTGLAVLNVENACSSGGAGLQLARQALLAGDHDVVVVVGVEKMPRGMMRMDYFDSWRQHSGHASNPAQFAFAIRRHMHDHGTTTPQLAKVAEKNHAHSRYNPNAMYRRPVPVEEVLASRPVADPLRMLMLCAPNEGAAAVVLRRRPARPGDIRLRGHGLRTALLHQPVGEHMPTYTPAPTGPTPSVTRLAADDAYRRAGLGPDDLDVVELQDTDCGTEIISTEELGLCAPGEGGALVESGATTLGGRQPVNPSGGLLSKGEPVGASGLGQVHEIVHQLRDRAGARQVPGARIGLTHALGAGGNCSVMIFDRV